MIEPEKQALRRLEQFARELTDATNNVQPREWPRGRYNRRDIAMIVRDLELALVHLDGCRAEPQQPATPHLSHDEMVAAIDGGHANAQAMAAILKE